MNIRKSIKNKIDGITNKIDIKLLEYVKRYISDDISKLEKSLAIYLCLGDVLCYSPEFSLTYNYDRTSDISDVNLENNEIMCKSWSILYHRLLKQFGIYSKLVKTRGHYKVEIPMNGVLYSADATGYGTYGIHYSMSDIARIKFGFMIERFIVSSAINPDDLELFVLRNKELKDLIVKVYRKQNRKYYSKELLSNWIKNVMLKIESNRDRVGFATLEDVEYRIKIINRFWRLNISNSPLEKVQLFNNYFKVIFGDYEEYEAKCYNIYSSVNGNIFIYKLIAIEINEKYYYYLDDGKRFKGYNVRDLLIEFKNRNVKISDFVEVLGIYSGLENFKCLSK